MRLRTQPWHGGPNAAGGTAGFFLAFLAVVFAVEFAIMAVLPLVVPPAAPAWTASLLDGAALTAILAPLVWFGFVRPTQRLHESRGQLLDRLLAAQEEERRRIAADLHDGLGQNLTTILLRLRVLEDSATSGPERDNAAALRGIAAASLAEVRQMVRATRPPVLDDCGLAAAIERQLEEVAAATGLEVSLVWPRGEEVRFAPEIETALYRAIQEAVTNAIRHADGRRLTVSVAAGADAVTATVRDDGRGFDVREALLAARRPFGLLGLRERVAPLAGTVDVTIEPGHGTTVVIRIPFPRGDRP